MKELIQHAYTLFKSYSVERPLDICTDCCMSVSNEKLLSELPVSQISMELLREYNDGAATDFTPIHELKHFLPKYIELIGNFEFPSHSVELSLKRLNAFKENEWTIEERAFLNNFSISFFKGCLSKYPLPENERIDSILLMFWMGEFQLSELLNHWKLDRSLASTLHFKDLYLNGFKDNNPLKMWSSFGDPEVSKILRNWLDDSSVRIIFKENIERIIMRDESVDYFESIDLNMLYEQLIYRQ